MDSPVGFHQVLEDERNEIKRSRAARDCPPGEPGEDSLGVAFSGGGIRSATFNLGVLQTLARHGLLRRIDYLSTVSGGGYIGSWLQAWIQRTPGGVNEIERQLSGDEPPQVGWLRRYSNYLTPRLGLFGADTWAVVAIYLRNLILTQTVLVSFIVLCLTFAWALFRPLAAMGASSVSGWFALLGIAAMAMLGFRNLGAFDPKRAGKRAQFMIQTRVVVPLLGVAILASIAVVAFPDMGIVSWTTTLAGVFLASTWVAAAAARAGGEVGPTLASRTILHPRLLTGALVGGAVAGAILGALVPCAALWSDATRAVCLPPLVLVLFALASTVQVGVAGRAYSESSFEWWGRLGGWMLIYAAGWFLLMGLALFGAAIFEWLCGIPGALPAWVATWLGGIVAGTSGKDRPSGETSTVRTVLTRIAPYGFVVGLLILIAAGYDRVANSDSTMLRLGVLAGAGLLVWRFSQINRLSVHGLYRNRLVRCYLGASNAKREEDSFTGFSPGDDLDLADLPVDVGPYAIVNTAVNSASGENLAWQERKASSFTFTRDRCGFDGSYRPTASYGRGYTLGSALAISGAAASPNMGFRTTRAFAFLMAMFNIRLGWWTGNPRDPKAWKLQAPPQLAFAYLLRELLGNASSQAPHVYLSDGGHFENLGIYELVRRRCRFIIASDAGCDGSFKFDDLGNAVRKCRTDFGAEIEIDLGDLVPGEDGHSARHCAVGTITYSDGMRGTLVYLKPSLTADETADVRNYAAEHAAFPHETTGDQWFAESQFESYRQLGGHIAHKTLERAHLSEPTLAKYFTDLRYAWVASAGGSKERAARHVETLGSLVTQLRTDATLAYLDESFWPEWSAVAGDLVRVPQRKTQTTRRTNAKLTGDQFRAGYYFCMSLIQLMENAFLDLGLDDPRQRTHPDNRGWMNLFRHFSWAGMFRLTWAISASTYGVRFQNFCQGALDLQVGDELCLVEHPMNAGQASTVKRRWSALLKRATELNFHERDLLTKMIGLPGFDAGAGQLTLYTFRLDVTDQSGRLPETGFPCGFAVVQRVNKRKAPHLRVLRIPDHLRQMGLARRALRALCDEFGDKPMLQEPRGEPDGLLATQLRRGRSALQRILDSIDA